MMEGFSANNYTEDGSPAAERGSSSPPSADIMLAEYHPKKRAGRKKFKETRHPVYRGIRQRNSGKWVCETREPIKQTRIWLGTFPTAEMAARAHDVATIALRGRSACLNFSDSAWRLPVPASGDTKDIQQAAAQAAEMFRPPSQAAAAVEEAAAAPAPPPSEEGYMYSGMNEGVGGLMDEDFFDMPGILDDMYNGMMLPPPGCGYVVDDYPEDDVDFSLWNF